MMHGEAESSNVHISWLLTIFVFEGRWLVMVKLFSVYALKRKEEKVPLVSFSRMYHSICPFLLSASPPGIPRFDKDPLLCVDLSL